MKMKVVKRVNNAVMPKIPHAPFTLVWERIS